MLFTHNSGLFRNPDLRARVAEIARAARTDSDIQEDFLEYFGLLVYAAFEGSSILSPADCLEIVQDTEWIATVWSAVVAQPLNPRRAGSLRKQRQQLLDSKVPGILLPTPSWWASLEEENFFTS